MNRTFAFVAFILGAFGAAVWFIYSSGNTNITSLSDLWQQVQADFRQTGNTIVGGAETVTGTSDPLTKATQMIAGFEGFSAHAYPDANGCSIGYGHFITANDAWDCNSIISESDAYNLLQSDVAIFADCIQGVVTVDLSVNQAAALISLCYNIGCAAFKSSTLLRDVNAGNFDAAFQQFSVWNKSGGQVVQALVDRRAEEATVFNS